MNGHILILISICDPSYLYYIYIYIYMHIYVYIYNRYKLHLNNSFHLKTDSSMIWYYQDKISTDT